MARYAHVIMVIAVAFTSLSSILVRLSTAPPLVVAAWRMIIAAVLLSFGPVVTGFRRGTSYIPSFRPGTSLPSTSQTSPESPSEGVSPDGIQRGVRRPAILVIASGTFLALHFATWITSLSYTSVVHSTVLVTIHPVIVLVGSALFLGRPIEMKRLGGTIAALIGAVVLAGGGSVSGRVPTLGGDLLAAGGAVAVAGYIVIGSFVRRTMTARWYNFSVHLVAALVLIGLAGVFRRPLYPYALREYMIFAALAVFCTILGHSLLNWTLRYVSAPDVSLSILMEPVFASILAAFLFGEVPGLQTIFGASVVLASLAYIRLSRSV